MNKTNFQYPTRNNQLPNMDKNNKYDLQDRFIEFAVRIIKVAEKLPNSKTDKHIASQIIKSGTSVGYWKLSLK